VQLNPYYRSFELAWEPDPDDQRRFREDFKLGLLHPMQTKAVIAQAQRFGQREALG